MYLLIYIKFNAKLLYILSTYKHTRISIAVDSGKIPACAGNRAQARRVQSVPAGVLFFGGDSSRQIFVSHLSRRDKFVDDGLLHHRGRKVRADRSTECLR